MPEFESPNSQKSTNGRFLWLQLPLRALSRLAPGLAARLAERLFITPLRFRVPPREAVWEEPARRLTVGGLAVWIWGSGPRTVLLVHGWAGRGLQLGAFAQPLVERGFRVVAFDGPGHGLSPGRRSSLPEVATAIAGVARHFGPLEAVVAHSFGAAASLLARARGKLEVERVVFIAPFARLQGVLERFSDLTGFSLEVMARMRRRLEARFDFRWHSGEPLRLATGQTLPALVIHDRGDREIPFEEGRDLAAAWPGARLLATTGLGHYRLLRDPRVIASAVGFVAADAPDDQPAAGLAAPERSQGPSRRPRPLPRAHRLEGTMTPILSRVRRLVRRLALVAIHPLSLTLDSWDLQLDPREIERQLAYGRD